MVLANAQKGNRHCVSEILASGAVQGKLAAMGLVPGSEIEILQSSLHGAAIVSCRGAQLVLGRGLAQMIQLED